MRQDTAGVVTLLQKGQYGAGPTTVQIVVASG